MTGTTTARTVSLFSGHATQKAMEDEILPAFTAGTGIPLEVSFDPTTELQRRIAAGERPDVVVVATPSLDGLAATGAVDPATARPLVTTVIGVGVARGAPHPDVSTVAALTDTFRRARSIAWSQAGQSGIYLRTLLDRLGIRGEVEPRATVLPRGFTGTAVVDGRADLAVQQLSELAYVPGVEIVGPLPDEVQHVTEFSVALGADATAVPEVLALRDFLAGPLAEDAYRRSGLSPA
ncbi:substrate-binding domain-containing protein [Geodermatophilus sp. YIM 151500]|uniref:substrate-binding domain-containing protein n=1 Tax=Geodermatophilus sp. YIM 151500 TaxID=2984531 RepID=UPI0021E3B68C|nr:substrate-binding domain-containing protein [Geodermatophilus sp. YIM 151500]MCV2488989.1 substrate-binding domain-containing protein [Geodermatophilus sp. YIM 151500]